MAITVKHGGAWRAVVPYVRVGGVWRNALVHARTGGTWHAVGGAPVVNSSTTLVTGFCSRTSTGTCSATTESVTVSVVGGSGSYSYSWEQVSGTGALVNTPNGATTTFTRSATAILDGNTVEGVYRCKVTDTVTGLVGYSPNITVRTTHTMIQV